MDHLDIIREKEKEYYEQFYRENTLFEEGSWLSRPVSTVMHEFTKLNYKHNVNVLDLGCGVGRNAIPIAIELKDMGGVIDCVDCLESALEILKINCSQHKVTDHVRTHHTTVEDFKVKENHYSFVVAVSILEHLESVDVLVKKLEELRDGTRNDGVIVVIVNTEITESDYETNQQLEPMFKLNLATNQFIDLFDDVFIDWTLDKRQVNNMEFIIKREHKKVLLKSKVVTCVVKNVSF